MMNWLSKFSSNRAFIHLYTFMLEKFVRLWEFFKSIKIKEYNFPNYY